MLLLEIRSQLLSAHPQLSRSFVGIPIIDQISLLFSGLSPHRKLNPGFVVNCDAWQIFNFFGSILSKKHDVVSQSSVEDKYKVMAHTYCELLLISLHLVDLGAQVPNSIPLFCDNVAMHIDV